MNQLQKQLLTVICSLLQSENFDVAVKNSAIRYGFLNYIAKYSLAKDYYLVTPAAKNLLEIGGFVSNGRLRRGSKSRRNGFTFEHPIPANVVANELLAKRNDLDHARNVLDWADAVIVLTSEEEKRLGGSLRSKMPNGWRFFESNRYARYAQVGMQIDEESEKIPVYGSIRR